MATDSGLDPLESAVKAIEDDGMPVPVRTGGGAGMSPFDLGRDVLTEIQPGSYVFMDSRDGGIGRPGRNAPPFGQALHILTSVVSKPVADRAVLDAGLKAASCDHGPPRIADLENALFEFGGDEHGIVRMEGGGEVPLALGEKIRLVPSHCDTTINLYEQFMIVQGGNVVDVWPIEGAGTGAVSRLPEWP